MTVQQNDALYQLLAKNLEGRGSVGVVKLPGINRGIVIVALPGQSKLVGLIFLTTPLPPKTPGSGQARQANPLQQQQQQAYQQLQQQQAQQFQTQPAINKTLQQSQHQPQFQTFQSPQQSASMPAQQYNYNAPTAQNQMPYQQPNQQPFNMQPNNASAPVQGSLFTDAQFQEMLAAMQRQQ
jgi:hypothetical protein